MLEADHGLDQGRVRGRFIPGHRPGAGFLGLGDLRSGQATVPVDGEPVCAGSEDAAERARRRGSPPGRCADVRADSGSAACRALRPSLVTR